MLTRRAAGDSLESLASTLVDAQVDLNPHQVEAALFACKNPLSRGVILADEVGLGKTIEAGLVISQHWAERRRRILITVPANLRKQWHQELKDKFGLQGIILEAKSYKALRKQGARNPFEYDHGPVLCSYQFAKAKVDDVRRVNWDLVVLDEAHRLRNVYKPSNVIGKALKEAFERVHSKVLLTATPLQNSLLELYGLVSIIDDRVFGDLDSFRAQFSSQARDTAFAGLRARLAPLCKRTLRRQVQPYVSYTARRAIVQEFTPSTEERELSQLVADYLRRPNLKALPDGQRQLISLVLWTLLASSTHAIAGALDTMANRLQRLLEPTQEPPDLAEELDADYESLEETADEWDEPGAVVENPRADEQAAIVKEISERDFIYATTQNLSAAQLQALADEVSLSPSPSPEGRGETGSLLVCCSAFHGVKATQASERWPNLTLKKIPKMVLARCEWGHDDYSLNVANLPMAAPEPELDSSAKMVKQSPSRLVNPAQASLFSEDDG